ncbi:MAG: hypothetical protein ABEH61_00910 [Haloarculaceae archaeon]
MPRWRDNAAELLYDGESIQETVDFGDARVVVTSHRVLAFAPEIEGANFRQVDRPNVSGVTTGSQTESTLLERSVRFGVVGAVLIVAGSVIDFGSIVGDVDLGGGGAVGRVGLGGMLGALGAMLAILQDLDQYMQLFGALALLLAVVLFGVYWYLRDTTLVLRIDGDDDIHLPRPDDAAATADRLEDALRSRPSGDPDPGEP